METTPSVRRRKPQLSIFSQPQGRRGNLHSVFGSTFCWLDSTEHQCLCPAAGLNCFSSNLGSHCPTTETPTWSQTKQLQAPILSHPKEHLHPPPHGTALWHPTTQTTSHRADFCPNTSFKCIKLMQALWPIDDGTHFHPPLSPLQPSLPCNPTPHAPLVLHTQISTVLTLASNVTKSSNSSGQAGASSSGVYPISYSWLSGSAEENEKDSPKGNALP